MTGYLCCMGKEVDDGINGRNENEQSSSADLELAGHE